MIREELEKEYLKDESKYLIEDNEGNLINITNKVKESWNNGYLAGAEKSGKRIEELDKENGKLEGKLSDLQSEYIELENFHNNEVKGLKDILEGVESENVRLIGKLAFTENTLNNRIAQIEELKQLLQDIIVSSGSDREELLKEAEHFLKEADE